MGTNTRKTTTPTRLLKKARELHAANDQRWLEALAELVATKGYKTLGYSTVTALAAGEFSITDSKLASNLARAGKARLALKAARVPVPNTGVSINALRRIDAADIPLIAQAVANGHDINTALRSAINDTLPRPLFTRPEERPERGDEFHPNLVMLAQVVELLGYSTPVRDLIDGETVLVACADGLTNILTALQQVDEQSPTINQNRSA